MWPRSAFKARVPLSHKCTWCTVISPATVADPESAAVPSLPPAHKRERQIWDQRLAHQSAQRPSLCGARRLIGPASRPMSRQRGLRKAPPRTRAVCTQESEAGQRCCVSPVRAGQMTCGAAFRLAAADEEKQQQRRCFLLFSILPLFLPFLCYARTTTWWWRRKRRSSHMFTHGAAPHLSCSLHQHIAAGKWSVSCYLELVSGDYCSVCLVISVLLVRMSDAFVASPPALFFSPRTQRPSHVVTLAVIMIVSITDQTKFSVNQWVLQMNE